MKASMRSVHSLDVLGTHADSLTPQLGSALARGTLVRISEMMKLVDVYVLIQGSYSYMRFSLYGPTSSTRISPTSARIHGHIFSAVVAESKLAECVAHGSEVELGFVKQTNQTLALTWRIFLASIKIL